MLPVGTSVVGTGVVSQLTHRMVHNDACILKRHAVVWLRPYLSCQHEFSLVQAAELVPPKHQLLSGTTSQHQSQLLLKVGTRPDSRGVAANVGL